MECPKERQGGGARLTEPDAHISDRGSRVRSRPRMALRQQLTDPAHRGCRGARRGDVHALVSDHRPIDSRRCRLGEWIRRWGQRHPLLPAATGGIPIQRRSDEYCQYVPPPGIRSEFGHDDPPGHCGICAARSDRKPREPVRLFTHVRILGIDLGTVSLERQRRLLRNQLHQLGWQ